MSRYNFFVTHHAGITYVSLTSWIFRLEGELQGEFEAGTDFRIGLLVNSQSTRDRIYAQPAADVAVPLAACVALRDPDVGYFLLSGTPYEPIAITFDSPEMDSMVPIRQEASPTRDREPSMVPLDFYEPRPVYNPPRAFDEGSALPMLLERLRTSRHKTIVNQEVKLSPLTLQIFTDAHKVLSDETYKLGVATAEIFRRCELLQTELKQQVQKANEVKGKIDTINGVHRDDESDNTMYDRRIFDARKRQERIAKRVDDLRKIVGKATTRDLSNKERAFVEEVRTLSASVSGPQEGEDADTNRQSNELWKRLENVKRLQAELIVDVESLKNQGQGTMEPPSSTQELRIPQDIRRTKLQQVQSLLSRETALVEAVTSRLERLQATV
jgi:nucleoporin NUP82